MEVDDPPPEPPESATQIVAKLLDDLRRVGYTVPTHAITRLAAGDGVPTVQQSLASTLQDARPSQVPSTLQTGDHLVQADRHSNPHANSQPEHRMEGGEFPAAIRTTGQAAAVVTTTPPFVFTSSQALSERLRPTGGVFDTATQNHHSNLHNGVQVGVNSTRITSELGTQQQSRGYLQSSDQVNATFGSQNILNYSTVNASVVPIANFDSATVHGLNAFNNANVVGSAAQQSTGLTSGTTAPIFGTLSSNLAGQGGTLPTASPSVAVGNANYVASPLIANNATNLISSVHGPSVSDLNANNLINNLANVEINNLATVSNFETLPAAHNETSKFVHGINSLNYVPGANVLHNAILGNSNLAPVVNSLNNAYVNNNLPTVSTNADNPSDLHGLNSLNNANFSSALPTALFGNTNLVPVSVNLPTGNINNSNAALGSTTLPTVHNATTIDKNNAKSGGGTAFTNARHNHTSKNPNNSRVNFQPSVQPSGGGVSQPPNAQNQAQEGTGLTKSQKRTLAKKRRREKGKDPIIDVGLGNFSVPQVAVGVGTSTNPVLGLSHSQPVAPIPISTCNAFTLLQDVNETAQAEGTHTQEVAHDTTLANQAHTQEATTKDFDAELDDHLAKVEDSSIQGDASSAAPISMGLQTPVREQGTGLCLLNTEQATIPTVSPVARNTKAPVTKRTRRTRSASEQSNVAGFYREASDDDDDSDSSVAGRVAIFESAGRNREFVGGHGSPPKTSKVPFGGRITRSQVRPEQSSAAVGTPISSQSPSLDSFRLRLGFDSAFAGVDDKLWLFWNSDLTLSFESDSDQSVSVSCIHATIPTAFWVSFVYAKTKEHLRVSLWAELCLVSNKVNWTVSMDNLSCGFFVRNSKGGFCLAGVYSVVGGSGMDELIKIMLTSCLEWCEQKSYYSVYLETEDWRGLRDDIMDIPPLRIKKIQCAPRVNCVAACLVNSCKGSNVIFCSREGLPRGLGRILALEGIPHFVVAPGVDAL
nr:uncharacterized protein LOC109147873 [Ipomoea batatas]